MQGFVKHFCLTKPQILIAIRCQDHKTSVQSFSLNAHLSVNQGCQVCIITCRKCLWIFYLQSFSRKVQVMQKGVAYVEFWYLCCYCWITFGLVLIRRRSGNPAITHTLHSYATSFNTNCK